FRHGSNTAKSKLSPDLVPGNRRTVRDTTNARHDRRLSNCRAAPAFLANSGHFKSAIGIENGKSKAMPLTLGSFRKLATRSGMVQPRRFRFHIRWSEFLVTSFWFRPSVVM